MRRLREEIDSTDRALARAASLVSSMRPLETERMCRSLPVARVASTRKSYLVPAGLVALVTTATAAAATGTMHAHWFFGRGGSTQPSVIPGAGDAHGPSNAKHAARGQHQGEDIGDPSGIVPDEVPVTALPTAPSRRGTVPARGPAREVPHDPAAADNDESALIVEAVRALRRDGDAARAEQLAERALQRYPHGQQVEEAMALAMEAASERGDPSDARRAAQRYLSSFRAGRFADRATRILATPDR